MLKNKDKQDYLGLVGFDLELDTDTEEYLKIENYWATEETDLNLA